MHCINTTTFQRSKATRSYFAREEYAVLSHRWTANEITFEDYSNHMATLRDAKDGISPSQPGGLSKIHHASRIARCEGIQWLWIDTCCIDKENKTELNEHINEMFKWYADAKLCLTHLGDVQVGPGDIQSNKLPGVVGADGHQVLGPNGSPLPSSWFSRGWTLQELLAPSRNIFYDINWQVIGTRKNLAPALEDVTRIPQRYLDGEADFRAASVAAKMSWMAERTTEREEDIAYSMLGILNVTMQIEYGEGQEKAFVRLQQEFLRTMSDETIFVWRIPTTSGVSPSRDRKAGGPNGHDLADYEWGLLAASPDWFRDSGDITLRSDLDARGRGEIYVNDFGLSVRCSAGSTATKVQNGGELVGSFAAGVIIIGAPPYLYWLNHREKRMDRKLTLFAGSRDARGKWRSAQLRIRPKGEPCYWQDPSRYGDSEWPGYVRVGCEKYDMVNDKPYRRKRRLQLFQP